MSPHWLEEDVEFFEAHGDAQGVGSEVLSIVSIVSFAHRVLIVICGDLRPKERHCISPVAFIAWDVEVDDAARYLVETKIASLAEIALLLFRGCVPHRNILPHVAVRGETTQQ